MEMKKYLVYLEDSGTQEVYKVAVPATSIKKAIEYVSGNGDIVTVKDVTKDYPINACALVQALRTAGFDKIEIDLIVRALELTNIVQ